MNAALNILSFALLGLAAVGYARRRRLVLATAAFLFFPICWTSLVTTWWPVSPVAALTIAVGTLGISLAILFLFAVDVVWAPFAVEMTYLTFVCWLLSSAAVLFDWVGSLLRLLASS